MSSHAVPRSPSWFRKFTGLFGQVPAPRAGSKAARRRPLSFEPLETRSLLSATIAPSISGVVFNDAKHDGLVADGTPLANVTVNLFRDGGDGVFEGKATGSDDTLVSSTTTDSNGKYSFANLTAGTYFVQQVSVPGLVSSAGVATVNISAADTAGVTGKVIDSFSQTPQFVAGAPFQSTSSGVATAPASGTSGSSVAAASEAIGGYRDVYVQLTAPTVRSRWGPTPTPPTCWNSRPAPPPTAVYWVTWDGQNTNAQVLNPTGLGQLDLTSQGRQHRHRGYPRGRPRQRLRDAEDLLRRHQLVLRHRHHPQYG